MSAIVGKPGSSIIPGVFGNRNRLRATNSWLWTLETGFSAT